MTQTHTHLDAARAVVLAALVVLSTAAVPVAVTAAGDTAVSLDPGSKTIERNETTTFAVVVENANGGVGSYDLQVNVSDPAVAHVTNVTFGGDPGYTKVTTNADNTSVEIEAAVADTADTGAVTVATVTVKGDAGGETSLDLSVDSVGDESGTDYSVTTVNDATLDVNAPPTASVTATPTETGVNETVTANASDSSDPDGTATSFRWDYDDDPAFDRNTSGPVINVSYADPGNRTIRVEVVDGDGLTDTASVRVVVRDRTEPRAVAELNRTNVTVGSAVRLDGSSSRDNVGVATHVWTVTAPDGSETTLNGEVETFTPQTGGTYTVTLTVADAAGNSDNTTATFVAERPANLTVNYIVNSTELLTNETLGVTVGVENVGDRSGTREVNLVVNGSTVAAESVTLDGGESTTVTFNRTFTEGNHEVTVEDLPATTVVVQEPANLSTTFDTSDTRLLTNESFRVNVTVENTGDVAANATYTLSVDGEAVANRTVEVPGESNRTVRFEENLTAGPHEVHVNGLLVAQVEVREPANLSTSYIVNRTELLTNETFGVTATVTNTGGVEGNQSVELVVDGEVVNATTVAVPANASVNVSFARGLAAGNHAVTVNTLPSTAVTVLEPAKLTVEYAVPEIRVLTNETVAVNATVTNTGDLSGTTNVTLFVDGAPVDTRSVTVDGGSRQEVQFRVSLSAGNHSVTVDDLPPTSVTALDPANLSINYEVTPTELLTTEQVTVNATVANTGDLAGDQRVDLVMDGQVVDSRNVTVEGDSAETVTFSTRISDAGNHTVTVGDLNATTITVELATNPDAGVDVVAPAAGTATNASEMTLDSTVTLNYTLANTEDGIAGVVYRVDGGQWHTVADGLNTTEVAVDLAALSVGEHELAVALRDNLGNVIDETTTTVVVDRAAPNVSLDASRSTAVSRSTPTDLTVNVSDATQAGGQTTLTVVAADGTVVRRVDLTDRVADGTDTVRWNATDASGAAVPSGTYTVRVTSVDAAGNVRVRTTNLSVDTSPPSATVTSLSGGVARENGRYLNGSSSLTVAGTASDDQSGVRRVVVRAVSNTTSYETATTTTVSNGSFEATVDLGDAPNGEYHVEVTPMDGANNTATTVNGTTFVYDTADPVLGAAIQQVNATHGRVVLTTSERLAETPTPSVSIPGSNQSVTLTKQTATRYTGTFTFGESGTYSVSVGGRDLANNAVTARSSTTVDTNVQVENGTALVENDATGTFLELHTDEDVQGAFAALTTSDAPLAALATNLTGSQFIEGDLGASLSDNLTYAKVGIPVNESKLPEGYEPEDVEVRRYNETTGSWEVVGNTTVQNRTIDGETRRYYVVNVSHFSTYGAVSEDDTNPSFTDTSLTPDAAESPFAYGTDTVEASFNYEDGGTGINVSAVEVYFDEQPVSEVPGVSADVTESGVTVTASGLTGSGDHTVTVVTADEAGNTNTSTRSFRVEPDTSAPSLDPSFANGTTFQYGVDAVTARVDYSDALSGVDTGSVTVTVDGETVTENATVDSGYVAYTFSEPVSGTHTVTVTVTDEAGNADSVTRGFSVETDTAAPQVSNTVFNPASASTGETVRFDPGTSSVTANLSIEDALSGVNASAISVWFGENGTFTEVTSSAVVTDSKVEYTAYGLDDETTYTLRVRLADNAGNAGNVSRTFTVSEPPERMPELGRASLSPVTADGTVPADTSEITLRVPVADADGDLSASGVTVTVDGQPVSDVSLDSGFVVATLPSLSAGNHSVVVSVTDAAGNADERRLTVRVAASGTDGSGAGGGGGGGGGGGQGGGSSGPSVNVIPVADGVTINVRDAGIGATFSRSLGDSVRANGVSITDLQVGMTFADSRFRIEMSKPTTSPLNGRALEEASAMQYFEANAIGVRDSDIDHATFRFTVAASVLPSDTSYDDVVVYRYNDGAWHALETRHLGDGVFEAQSPGFSTFAIAVQPADQSDATPTSTPTSTATPTPTPADEDGDGSATTTEPADGTQTPERTKTTFPGFGAVTALVALLLAMLLARRREA